jgi:hypothetical protein
VIDVVCSVLRGSSHGSVIVVSPFSTMVLSSKIPFSVFCHTLFLLVPFYTLLLNEASSRRCQVDAAVYFACTVSPSFAEYV